MTRVVRAGWSSVALGPSGQVHLHDSPTASDAATASNWDAPAMARVATAFEDGDGAAVVHLGATEVDVALPPVAAVLARPVAPSHAETIPFGSSP
jgi:hypothetical protein